MRVGVHLPREAQHGKGPVLYGVSGLPCTEKNVITKAAVQRDAAENGIAVVGPDSSARGEGVADEPAYDLGQGAGFYVNATQEPWAANHRMYDYVVQELPALIEAHFPVTAERSISGHSMGGHGALVIALRNPGRYRSVSAFSPIVAPTQVPWGHKAFEAYLGSDREAWKQYDTVELIRTVQERLPLLVDQGLGDEFLESQLQPDLLRKACDETGHPLTLNLRPGYDHSYYFIASFIGEHMAHHASALKR
ncbi:S-formylglutathione hydrolase [Pseudomonas aeruginosa]|nr:S-formylglutathione hydrolase [Pseudomonas aeruginosa]